jgi:octaprenyl-diphosphate synthase
MILGDELNLVENMLRRAAASEVGLLSKASEYIILSGGKRLRPRVVLLSFTAAGGEDTSLVAPLAAAVELLHTASLVHDDINDRGNVRRGQATVNAQWGNGLALLTGDFMFIGLLKLIAAFDSRIVGIVADSCTALVEGEALQMLSLGDMEMTEETYFRIVGQKTASLFSASAELGAIVAEGAEQEIAALKEYGFCLGTAFQIRDDTLDLVGRSDTLGKPVASDLKQGKLTLASIFALRTSEQARDILSSRDPRHVAHMLRDTGAIDYAMRTAAEYAEKAKGALGVLAGSEARAALLGLADFVVARES